MVSKKVGMLGPGSWGRTNRYVGLQIIGQFYTVFSFHTHKNRLHFCDRMALSIDAVKSDSSASEAAGRGEAAWHARRQAWRNPPNPQASTTPPEVTNMLLNIQSKDHLRHIYKSLVIDRRGFNHSVPLGFAVRSFFNVLGCPRVSHDTND